MVFSDQANALLACAHDSSKWVAKRSACCVCGNLDPFCPW